MLACTSDADDAPLGAGTLWLFRQVPQVTDGINLEA
jgi:hypothetical protein